MKLVIKITKVTQNKAFKAVISFQRYNLPRINFRTIFGRLSTRRNHIFLNNIIIFKQKENIMSQLSFKSEGLVVDYLSFNITGCTDPAPIANYLSDSFGFNSVVKETFQGKSEDLIFKIRNGYKVSFIKSTYNSESNSYWTGLIVRFSGKKNILIRSYKDNWSIDIVWIYFVRILVDLTYITFENPKPIWIF